MAGLDEEAERITSLDDKGKGSGFNGGIKKMC